MVLGDFLNGMKKRHMYCFRHMTETSIALLLNDMANKQSTFTYKGDRSVGPILPWASFNLGLPYECT